MIEKCFFKLLFVKFSINFGLKITLRRFYKIQGIDRKNIRSLKSKHSLFDNLMNFKKSS